MILFIVQNRIVSYRIVSKKVWNEELLKVLFPVKNV